MVEPNVNISHFKCVKLSDGIAAKCNRFTSDQLDQVNWPRTVRFNWTDHTVACRDIRAVQA